MTGKARKGNEMRPFYRPFLLIGFRLSIRMQIGLELAKNYFLTPPNAEDKVVPLAILTGVV